MLSWSRGDAGRIAAADGPVSHSVALFRVHFVKIILVPKAKSGEAWLLTVNSLFDVLRFNFFLSFSEWYLNMVLKTLNQSVPSWFQEKN